VFGAIALCATAFTACNSEEMTVEAGECSCSRDDVISYLSSLPADEIGLLWAEFGPIVETAPPDPSGEQPTEAPEEGSVLGDILGSDEPSEPLAPDDEPEEPPASAVEEVAVTINEGCPMSLNRLLLARRIEDREPAGTEAPFEASSDDALYVYMDLNNRGGPDHQALITWQHAASEHEHSQSMDIGSSPNWRTWVRHRLNSRRVGTWTVEVAMEDGCELGTLTFEAVRPSVPDLNSSPTSF